MKNKRLIVITIIFFLVINTSYYWSGILGFIVLPLFLIFLFLVYLGLIIALIKQIYFLAKEKCKNKSRIIVIGLLACVLTLVSIQPYGVINFEKYESESVLIAKREGAANCMTILKLKKDHTFKEQSICFEVTEKKGIYRFQNDTIYFEKVIRGENDNYYAFAVIEPSKFRKDGKHFDLILYKNLTDTIGQALLITKNDLIIEQNNP